ncbi:MAG TPA: antibiotic biosynthesis monooxygenase [Chloroflexota bacterium]
MILEAVMLQVKPGEAADFEIVFRQASPLIAAMSGYAGHELHRCIETTNRYLLLVRWQRLEDHTVGFRESPEYQAWRRLLHHFYDPFPVVEHFEQVSLSDGQRENPS